MKKWPPLEMASCNGNEAFLVGSEAHRNEAVGRAKNTVGKFVPYVINRVQWRAPVIQLLGGWGC